MGCTCTGYSYSGLKEQAPSLTIQNSGNATAPCDPAAAYLGNNAGLYKS